MSPSGLPRPRNINGAEIKIATVATSNRPLGFRLTMRSASSPPTIRPGMPARPYTTIMPAFSLLRRCTRWRKGERKAPIAYMLKLCNAPDAIIHHIVGIDNTRR